MREARLVSVVIPLMNEERGVQELYRRLTDALHGRPYELVLVDDGSTDGTRAALRAMAEADPRVKVLELSRNFGHQAALTAGLDAASGDAVVMMDGDLQDPPELIPAMVERWRAGADVVVAVRSSRVGETRFKLATARRFYRLMSRLSNVPLTQDAGDFRLLDRRALDTLLSMREASRYLRGMTSWIGFPQASVTYERDQRHSGSTKFSFNRMLRFALDAIVSFSHAPLQFASIAGFVIAGLSFASIPVAVALRLTGQFVPGIATVVIAVLMLGGLQLMALGLIGEYIGRIYDEVKGRPLYVVQESRNFTRGEPTAEHAQRRSQHEGVPSNGQQR